MSEMSMQDIAAKMADIDFAMLVTKTEGGALAARPMSNNRDVDYDGTSRFFALDSTRMVADIGRDPQVILTMEGSAGLAGVVGKPPLYLSAQGRAEIVRDKAAFEAHWNPDLEYWFKEGTDTPGLVMIVVKAERLHYWDGEAEGDLLV
ncbi:pyridoxamine 5'-phosphate oxidase family protein [Roseobacter sp. HKCCA0434]|uniref:pyridoxamine 5'-phosphate oxidase family protein n=1 Tax=Roseobacter sp. HKCCA0434 TaxID=3079297 RepID=UPI0029059012|nr:pyridoxamine 5'-phosphate oxidase family protein [Roseobacter sp. HKCCA0434]